MNSAAVPAAPAAPAVVRSAMLDGRGHRSFLADIVIEHGPRDVLGRLFLKADTALREKGIFVSFADYDELRAANKANSDSWSPLLPVFDPAQGGLPEDQGLSLIGRNANGKPVFAQSSRVYQLGEGLLKDEIESLRMFYRDPAAMALSGEAMICSAPVAAATTGTVVFNGALWLHPEYRRLDIPYSTVPIARGALFTRWNPGLIFSFMVPKLVQAGLAAVARMHVDWEVTMINTPIKRGGTINAALVWLTAEEQHEHFRDYVAAASATGNAQVDGRVGERAPDQQRTG
jgi:hypothetical protein